MSKMLEVRQSVRLFFEYFFDRELQSLAVSRIKDRIQTTRDNFNASREHICSLMSKMLEVQQSVRLFIENIFFTASSILSRSELLYGSQI